MPNELLLETLLQFGGFGAVVFIAFRYFISQLEREQDKSLKASQLTVEMLKEQLSRRDDRLGEQEVYIRDQNKKSLETFIKVLHVLDTIAQDVPALHRRVEEHDREIKELNLELRNQIEDLRRGQG